MVKGVREQLPLLRSPSREEVASALQLAVNVGAGALVMKKTPAPEIGACELSLLWEAGHYLLTLNVLEEDGDVSVRTPSWQDASPGGAEIFGHVYTGARALSSIEFVGKVFDEFLVTGDVSLELLS